MFKGNRLIFRVDESASKLAQQIESKDVDDGTQDELFGETEYSEGKIMLIVESGMQDLRDVATDDPELNAQLEEGVMNILKGHQQELSQVNLITDAEITNLMESLESEIDQFADFMTEVVEIEGRMPESLELMSNVEGRISQIEFFAGGDETLLTIQSADENFPRDVEFVITTRDPQQLSELIKQKPNGEWITRKGKRKVQLTIVTDRYVSFQDYARDGHVRTGGGGMVLPVKFSRGSELQVLEQGGGERRIEVRREEKLFFQGGNLRATNNVLFVGADDITRTMLQDEHILDRDQIGTKMTREEAIALFETKFGKKVIVIGIPTEDGYELQPQSDFFHIDMLLTPLSNNEIIIVRVPETHPHYSYVEAIVAQIQAQQPNIKIHRLDVNVLDFSQAQQSETLNYNNALVETREKEDGTTERIIYIPKYNFDDYIAKLKSDIEKEEELIIKAIEEDDKYDLKTFQRYKNQDEERLKVISETDWEAVNKKAVEQYEQIGRENPDLNTRIVQIEVDAKRILRSGHGGSLNCITNEYRSPAK